MDYKQLWAKSNPYHPLWCHLLDIAAACKILLPRFGPVENLPDEWVCYLVGLHDIGKADAQFQNKDTECAAKITDWQPPVAEPGFRHEARSERWIKPHLIQQWRWNRHAVRVVAQAICGHHGNFAASCYSEDDRPISVAQWEPLRAELAQALRNALSLPDWQQEAFADASAVGMKLSGLIVLSDWIASNHELYRYNVATWTTDVSPAEYYQQALQEAERAVRRLELFTTKAAAETAMPAFVELWPHCHPIRPFQEVLENECRDGLVPGLAILEAPMGEGKTEAAVYLAHYWNRRAGKVGSYIALPTQATSNQMHQRYAAFLNAHYSDGVRPRLIHGMAWLLEQDTPQTPSQTSGDENESLRSLEWFRNAKRALIASEGVGTVDQALMAVLNVRHGFLRLLGLSAKTLIVDETHACNAYMSTILETLLPWCRVLGIPVILLSATLAHRQKQELAKAYCGKEVLPDLPPGGKEPYPLLTFVTPDGTCKLISASAEKSRRVALELYPGLLPDRTSESITETAHQTAELAVRLTENGGCACVLMNTVRGAQEVYAALKPLVPPEVPLLFHARYRAERRQEIEKKVLRLFGKSETGEVENPERPLRAILICTQVVEQSLDVDFDVMITQLAPIDLLLQRSGRLWRHERGLRPTGAEPTLHILMPPPERIADATDPKTPFGATGIVYPPELLLRTCALLRDKEWELPHDFRDLIEACYGDKAIPAGVVTEELLQIAASNRRKDVVEAQEKANTHLWPAPDPEVFQVAQMEETVEEDAEGGKKSYFHAQTRLGDETRNVLILHEENLVRVVREGIKAMRDGKDDNWPGMETLRRLFLQKAGVPAWWFQNLEPAEGYELLTEGPKWLRYHAVFVMRGGIWRGRRTTKQGQTEVVLRDCPERGLLMETPTREEEDHADV